MPDRRLYAVEIVTQLKQEEVKENFQFHSSDWRYGYIESVGVHPRTSTGVYNACIGDGKGRFRTGHREGEEIVIGAGGVLVTAGVDFEENVRGK